MKEDEIQLLNGLALLIKNEMSEIREKELDETKLQKYYDRITWSLKNEWPEIEKEEDYFKDFYDWYSFWAQDDMELIAEVAEDFNLEYKLDCKFLICEIIKRHKELNKSVQ